MWDIASENISDLERNDYFLSTFKKKKVLLKIKKILKILYFYDYYIFLY